jgi:hypothetical protein
VASGRRGIVADDGADALRHQIDVDAAPSLGHAWSVIVASRVVIGRLVVEVGCGEGRAAADLHLQLQGCETVAVPAVDPGLLAWRAVRVDALTPGLLEVVPHHRGQQTTPAVVGWTPTAVRPATGLTARTSPSGTDSCIGWDA